MRSLTFVLLLAPLLAQKPVPSASDIAKWESFGGAELSPDGRWLAVRVQRNNGDNELRVVPAAGGAPYVAAHGEGPAFSADSKWAAWAIGFHEKEQEKRTKEKKPLHKKLEIRDLSGGKPATLEAVESYAFSRAGAWLALRRPPAEGKDAATLVVRNLATGMDHTFANVTTYVWNDTAALLAFSVSNDDKVGNGADVYRIDLEDGSRRKLAVDVPAGASLSPAGRYALYVRGEHYFAVELDSGTTRNLTQGIAAAFVDKEDDHPAPQKPPFGQTIWTAGDRSVLLAAQFDIWEIPLNGGPARAITEGARDEASHQWLRLNLEEDAVDLSDPQYFNVVGRWSKKFGFARVAQGKYERLLWDDRAFTQLGKAKSADVFRFASARFDQPPALNLAGPELKGARAVLESNPFQKDFAWGRSELIEYKSPTGVRLQGILTYPANYDATRRYPMIVHIYEKLSGGLHSYVAPNERRPYNIADWHLRDYFVFQPDIVFQPRDPGRSVNECLAIAVKTALAKAPIDAKRVGLIGHSWGGYGTTFTVTQTDLFAAAVAGGPLTNLTSSYGEIYWNSGMPETSHAETGQERMEVPLYEDPQAFIRNSATFFADRMKTPLLLCVGDKDGASDPHQDYEMYNVARRAARSVVLLVYPGENHGLAKRANQIDYHRRIIEWFDHYLKGAAAPQWMTSGQTWLEREKALKK